MKHTVMIPTLAAISLFAVPALAFPPTFNLGAPMLIAHEACPDLDIAVNDTVSVAAEYTRLTLLKTSQTAPNGWVSILSFSAPDQGAYAFHGDIGMQYTREFLTHAWSGGEVWSFTGQDGTGDLDIVHGKDGVTTHCHLTNNTGG